MDTRLRYAVIVFAVLLYASSFRDAFAEYKREDPRVGSVNRIDIPLRSTVILYVSDKNRDPLHSQLELFKLKPSGNVCGALTWVRQSGYSNNLLTNLSFVDGGDSYALSVNPDINAHLRVENSDTTNNYPTSGRNTTSRRQRRPSHNRYNARRIPYRDNARRRSRLPASPDAK